MRALHSGQLGERSAQSSEWVWCCLLTCSYLGPHRDYSNREISQWCWLGWGWVDVTQCGVRLLLCESLPVCQADPVCKCSSVLLFLWLCWHTHRHTCGCPCAFFSAQINPQAGIAKGEEMGRGSKQPAFIHRTRRANSSVCLHSALASLLSWCQGRGTGAAMSAQGQDFVQKKSVQQNAVCVR